MFGNGVVGLIVGIGDHTVICAQSKALRRAHKEVLHPVTFLYKDQGSVLIWNLIPDA